MFIYIESIFINSILMYLNYFIIEACTVTFMFFMIVSACVNRKLIKVSIIFTHLRSRYQLLTRVSLN